MFDNKVVVITGASSGIGRATAKRFAENGANLVITYKSNEQGIKEVQANAEKLGVKCLALQVDFLDEKSISSSWNQIEEEYKVVDILINNAGVVGGGEPFLSSSSTHWHQVFQANFFGAVLYSQEAARLMLKNKSGKIINTSSIRGFNHVGREGVMAYSAAKAALNNFTLTLAKKLAPLVQVNAIAPGFVDTPYYDTMEDSVRKKFIDDSLIKRFVSTDEIADGFIFLAQSDSITGQILTMDGGYTLIKG